MEQTLAGTVMDHLRFLSETIGPRPVGSELYQKAADYIDRAFRQAGLRLEEVQYECVDWQHRKTTLALNGERLPAVANVYSPSCDVMAPTMALCTPAELENADIAGKIAIFYGDLSAAPLIPMNCRVYNTGRDQRINALLAEKQPAAVITVNLNPPAVDSLIEDADQWVSSATVGAEVGLKLLDQVGQQARLVIDARRTPARARTLVGRKDGPSRPRVTLMAHYDSKVDTPAASDNGGGVAALLALVHILSRKALPFGLEFIAFGDEEYYAYSDPMYVDRWGEQMQDILVAVNMDGIGQRLGTNTVALMTASEPFREVVAGIVGRYPGLVWAEPWPQSNHSTFAWRGVPSIALTSRGVSNLAHQPSDRIEWMDEQKLNEVVALVVDVVEALQDRSPAWTRG